MAVDLGEYDHPSWLAAIGTVTGYLVILGLMTLALFGVPWALFTFL